jgi:hypothetical protein
LAGPQRHLQGETGVWIAEPVPEKLSNLPEPVPDGLRVNMQAACRRPGVVRAFQPREQRARKPVGMLGPQPPHRSDHLEIAADPVALADVLNALDPASPVRVPCLVVLPLTGPVGPVPSF